MAGFGATDVLVRGRSRRGLAFLVAVAVPLVLGLGCKVTNNELYENYVALLAAAEAIGFFLLPAITENGFPFVTGERRGPMRADREGIAFRGRALLSRAQIKNVAVEGLPGGARVVHVSALRKKADVHVEVTDEEMARALIDALGLDADQHVASFSVHEDPLRTRAKQLAARGAVALGGAAITGGVLFFSWPRQEAPLLLMALVPALLAYALVVPKMRLRTDVFLGADGLMLRHRGRARSIPLSAIVQVRGVAHECGASPAEALLVLEGGEELVLRFGAEPDALASAQHAAFVTRIRQLLSRRHRPRETGEALLRRGERDATEWTRHLSSLSAVEEGYRVAAMPVETLWRIVESAVADPSARVGALVALRAPCVGFDEEARARLKALALRTAQRDLRAALEAAAAGADAAAIVAEYDRALPC